jgi:hypothetical protein
MAFMGISQAELYTTDVLKRGVVETMALENPVLELLPFIEIAGNAYKYDWEKSLPNTEFRTVNSGYTAGTGEIVQQVEGLAILGGDVDIDKFIIQVKGNINDIKAIQVQMKAKAIANTYAHTFFNGDGAGNTFRGLFVRMADNATNYSIDQSLTVTDATNGVLVLDDLNTLIDQVQGGADVLFMTKKTKRIVLGLLQASNHYIENGQDAFGRPVNMYAGVPIRTVEDGQIPADKIVAVRFGEYDGVCGLQNGSITVRDLGEIDAQPVERVRIEWYCGLALFNPYAVAQLSGVQK